MGLLLPVLEFLAPLFKKLTTWLLLAIVILALLSYGLWQRLQAANVALAARPKVETHIEQQVKTVRVAGPVQYITKTIYLPNGTREVVREIDRAPVTTTTQKDSEMDKKVTPACAAPRPFPSRFVGLSTSPLDPQKAIGIKAGMTVFQALDVSTGYDLFGAGKDRIRVEAAVRF